MVKAGDSRRCRSVDVVVKNTKHANMSLSHSKNWALNGWFLSQVSVQIFQGGQDLNQKASPLSPPASDEMDGNIQPGATTESISNGHPSIAFVAQKAAAIFQVALVFSQGRSCEQTTLFRLWLCQVVLFFFISSCDEINRSINFFHSHLVSRPPDHSFLLFPPCDQITQQIYLFHFHLVIGPSHQSFFFFFPSCEQTTQ